ncbi:MAG: hypothetical protein AB1671_08090 [Thermodesulfobacteriota bacterium]|jgi:hypothetical protein
MMARKKASSVDRLEALRRVRKALPPPTRPKEPEKRYRRAAERRAARRAVERAAEEE